MKKFVGRVVQVEFDDHSMGVKNHEICRCTVYGVLNGVYSDHIEIVSWDVEDDDGSNAEAFNIIKSTIKSVKVLKIEKEI